MKRLTEPECEIIEFVQQTQSDEVNKGMILANINRNKSAINVALDKLVSKNCLSQKTENRFVYYFISESNEQVSIRDVVCPKCKSFRRVFNASQYVAMCKNRECATPTGKRTRFWIIKRSVRLQIGQTMPLNMA